MQVAITCRHGTLSDSAREHLKTKAEKLLHFHDRITAISVTCTFESHQSTVELLVDAEHKHNFVAAETAADATVAFDLAMHKMEHQLVKYKERLSDHHRGTVVEPVEPA